MSAPRNASEIEMIKNMDAIIANVTIVDPLRGTTKLG
jgi:hypothetical protein